MEKLNEKVNENGKMDWSRKNLTFLADMSSNGGRVRGQNPCSLRKFKFFFGLGKNDWNFMKKKIIFQLIMSVKV